MPRQCLKCLSPIAEGAPSHYGLHVKCFTSWFKLRKPEEFAGVMQRSESVPPKPDEPKEPNGNSSFFHGKFRKYSATLNDETYILKMKHNEAPELPDVEYVSNQIAKSTGIDVPDFYCIDFHGERAFVTKNFVKRSGNATLNHIYHYIKFNEEYDCETLIDLILEETERSYDVDLFVRTCLFDALIGNHDRHGLNLGFVVTPKQIALAPIYDNPSSLGLEYGSMLKAQFEPRGKIATSKTNEPTGKDYVAEFLSLGYSDAVVRFLRSVKMEKIKQLVEQSHCTPEMKEALMRLIARRYKEMCDAAPIKSK